MSNSVLIAAIVGSFLLVGAVGAVTAIAVDDGSGGTRVVQVRPVRVPGPGVPLPGPGRGPLLPALP